MVWAAGKRNRFSRDRAARLAQTAQRLAQASAETAAGLRLDPAETVGQGAGEGDARLDLDTRRLRYGIPVRVAAVVLGVVAIVAIISWVRAAPQARPIERPEASAAGDATSLSSVPSASATAAADVTVDVTVHVAGQVNSPGVLTLPALSRVADAIAAAGGPGPEADLDAINLARIVEDGEQIFVPTPGKDPPASGNEAVPAGGGGAAGGNGLVNINTADAAGLDGLAGVGPVLAQRIIDWRTTNGKFASVDGLLEVSGIGPSVLSKLRDQACV